MENVYINCFRVENESRQCFVLSTSGRQIFFVGNITILPFLPKRFFYYFYNFFNKISSQRHSLLRQIH